MPRASARNRNNRTVGARGSATDSSTQDHHLVTHILMPARLTGRRAPLMGQIVLLVVAAAWAAVLVPPLLRSRVENRPNSSVSDFRSQLSSLQRAMPGRGVTVRTMGRPLAPSTLGAPGGSRTPAAALRARQQPRCSRQPAAGRTPGGTRGQPHPRVAGPPAPPRRASARRAPVAPASASCARPPPRSSGAAPRCCTSSWRPPR